MTLNYASLYPAAPYGLEVQLSYNGLVLNTGKFAATIARDGGCYYVTAIAGLDDADVRFSEQARPDADGTIPGTSYYGSRTLTIEGYVVGLNPEKLRVYQQNLREAFGQNLTTEKSLIFLTGDATNGDVYINCRKSAPLAMKEAMPTQPSRFLRRDFQITLKASDPRFLSQLQVSTGVLNASTGSTMTAIQKGNYSSYPLLNITGPFGSGLTLTNSLTGTVFKLDTTIAAGTTLIADMQSRRVTLAGANAYSYLDSASQWMSFEPGTNTVTASAVTGATTASAIYYTFRHAFL